MKRWVTFLLIWGLLFAGALPTQAAEVEINLLSVVDAVLALPLKLINALIGPPPSDLKPGSLPIKKSPYLREA